MQLLFNVPPEADGVLLRGFLRRCAVSTELARAVKFHGSCFFADDAPILANRRVQAGQTIRFALPADGPGVEPQPEIPVRVVYEDAFAVVLEKPPHLAVHPTLNYPGGTLANGYAAWAAAHGHSPVFRPVNRIDKDTSGLVLAAKNGYAAPLLAEGVEKLYYAIVEGELPLGNAVAIASDERTEVATLCSILDVIADGVMSQTHIIHLAVLARHPDAHDAAAKVGEANLHAVLVLQHVEAGGVGLEVVGIEPGERERCLFLCIVLWFGVTRNHGQTCGQCHAGQSESFHLSCSLRVCLL